MNCQVSKYTRKHRRSSRDSHDYLGFAAQLQQKLHRAIEGVWRQELIEVSQVQDARPIPLRRISCHRGLVYHSAVARSLAARLGIVPGEIALTLLQSLELEGVYRGWVLEEGWLSFEVVDEAIALWLQECLTIPDLPQQAKMEAFPIHYLHRRCGHWLRLGREQGFFILGEPIRWSALSPREHFWSGLHPQEQQLIGAIVDLVDAREREFHRWEKAAWRLSEAAIAFHRSCRIWGETARENPDLTRARLGLIAITERLLGALLQPRELN